MIPILLILVALVMVVFPGIIGQPIRLRSAEWARAAATSLLVGFVALELALFLLALPTVLRAVDAAGFALICEHALAPIKAGGAEVGWVSLTLGVLIGTRGLHAGWRARRGARAVEVEPWLGLHEDRGDFELVVLPTTELLAVTVPSTKPQVVISEGLVQQLSPHELEVVLRHEEAHLRCKHWRYSLLASVVERALWPIPLVPQSTGTMRNALEAWADESAAGTSRSGRARVRSAMLTLASRGGMPRLPRVTHCGLRERARRLSGPASPTPIRVRLVVLAPLFVLGLTALMLLADWTAGAHHAVATTGYCLE